MKGKYAVTDGAFVWPVKNLAEARKKAKKLALSNLTKVWIIKPSKRKGYIVVEEYYVRKGKNGKYEVYKI